MDTEQSEAVVMDRALSSEIVDRGANWRIERWGGCDHVVDDYACFVDERFIGARPTVGMARALIRSYNVPDPS